jgi:hypothetical protein
MQTIILVEQDGATSIINMDDNNLKLLSYRDQWRGFEHLVAPFKLQEQGAHLGHREF